MWTLTGFADEISPDLTEQLALLDRLDVRHVEFRSAWGTKVLDLSPEQLATAKGMLTDSGVAVSSIGSDLGKMMVNQDFGPHLDRTRHAVEVARELGAPYIRVFSFFLPFGADGSPADPATHREEVLRRTRAMLDVAEDAGITLLHENEKFIYGDVPQRALELAEAMDSPRYRLVFDPANYVQCDVQPYTAAYPLVAPHTAYLHIKDAVTGTHEVKPAGEGDGQVREVLAAFRDDGFDGFLSLEPHLGAFDAYGGLCGPELWTQAHTALTGILRDLDIEWA